MSFPPTGLLKPSIQAHGILSIVTHGRGKPHKGTTLLWVGELTYSFTPVCIFLCHGVACRNLHFFSEGQFFTVQGISFREDAINLGLTSE